MRRNRRHGQFAFRFFLSIHLLLIVQLQLVTAGNGIAWNRHGIHVRRIIVSCKLSGRSIHNYELSKKKCTKIALARLFWLQTFKHDTKYIKAVHPAATIRVHMAIHCDNNKKEYYDSLTSHGNFTANGEGEKRQWLRCRQLIRAKILLKVCSCVCVCARCRLKYPMVCHKPSTNDKIFVGR